MTAVTIVSNAPQPEVECSMKTQGMIMKQIVVYWVIYSISMAEGRASDWRLLYESVSPQMKSSLWWAIETEAILLKKLIISHVVKILNELAWDRELVLRL